MVLIIFNGLIYSKLMSERQKARVIFCGVSNNEKRSFVVVVVVVRNGYMTLVTFALISDVYFIFLQNIGLNKFTTLFFTIHA